MPLACRPHFCRVEKVEEAGVFLRGGFKKYLSKELQFSALVPPSPDIKFMNDKCVSFLFTTREIREDKLVTAAPERGLVFRNRGTSGK